MNWGMISYEAPLECYPDTYNGQPLGYAALAVQKNHYGLYLMCLYAKGEYENWFREEFRKAGKKLDMGKSCVRFRKLEDLPLDVLGQAIARVQVETYIKEYETTRQG